MNKLKLEFGKGLCVVTMGPYCEHVARWLGEEIEKMQVEIKRHDIALATLEAQKDGELNGQAFKIQALEEMVRSLGGRP